MTTSLLLLLLAVYLFFGVVLTTVIYGDNEPDVLCIFAIMFWPVVLAGLIFWCVVAFAISIGKWIRKLIKRKEK